MENKDKLEIPWINEPEDILGIGFKNLLTYCHQDPEFHEKVVKLGQLVVFDFENLYAISVNFRNPIEILPFQGTPSGLGLKMSFNTLVSIMKREYSMVGAFLRGKLKISKWWRLLTLIRLFKILLPALKKASERAEDYGK